MSYNTEADKDKDKDKDTNKTDKKQIPCCFGDNCEGNGFTINGGWSAFPANKEQYARSCSACDYKVIEARNKYIDKCLEIYNTTGNNYPKDGCAYCGGHSFTVKYGTNQTVYGYWCSMSCPSMANDQMNGKIPRDNYW